MKYVNGSMLYFMTSLYEGLPISVIKTMSFEKAIVASDVLGNKDCVRDIKACIYVKELVRFMLYCLEHHEHG